MQYFESVACPEELFIPTEDPDAYRLYPAHRWVYNKLSICETQGIEHGPSGIEPPGYPVFCKPIYNLRGMGVGVSLLRSVEDYRRRCTPGQMWMAWCTGEHVSSDAALVAGQARWWRHALGREAPGGTFDYWTVEAESRPALEERCGAWLARHLAGFTGMINLETIGGTLIECHLRLADQWVDLNGPGWLESVVALYATGRWTFRDADRRTGYSVVLFGNHGRSYARPDEGFVHGLRRRHDLSSVQITFHEDEPPMAHAMPPGGFRLAVLNGWDLAAGLAARRELAEFWSLG
jgi:hypothetical protein